MAGKTLAMVAKKFGLKCKIFMGTKDIQRQKENVDAMKKYGAEVVPVTSGSQTLIDAVSECMRYWVANCDRISSSCRQHSRTKYLCQDMRESTSQISRELISSN